MQSAPSSPLIHTYMLALICMRCAYGLEQRCVKWTAQPDTPVLLVTSVLNVRSIWTSKFESSYNGDTHARIRAPLLISRWTPVFHWIVFFWGLSYSVFIYSLRGLLAKNSSLEAALHRVQGVSPKGYRVLLLYSMFVTWALDRRWQALSQALRNWSRAWRMYRRYPPTQNYNCRRWVVVQISNVTWSACLECTYCVYSLTGSEVYIYSVTLKFKLMWQLYFKTMALLALLWPVAFNGLHGSVVSATKQDPLLSTSQNSRSSFNVESYMWFNVRLPTFLRICCYTAL